MWDSSCIWDYYKQHNVCYNAVTWCSHLLKNRPLAQRVEHSNNFESIWGLIQGSSFPHPPTIDCKLLAEVYFLFWPHGSTTLTTWLVIFYWRKGMIMPCSQQTFRLVQFWPNHYFIISVKPLPYYMNTLQLKSWVIRWIYIILFLIKSTLPNNYSSRSVVSKVGGTTHLGAVERSGWEVRQKGEKGWH